MFSPNTQILVQGQGYLPLSHFRASIVDVWDGEAFVDAKVSEPIEGQICKIEFKGNHTITCSPEQKFLVKTKKDLQFIEAQNLKYPNSIILTNTTPKFDCLPKFENYTSWEQGFCFAVVHVYRSDNTLIIPADEFELIRKLKDIFYKNQIKYFTGVKHKNTKMDTVISFSNNEFLNTFTKIVPSMEFAKSKVFAEGYLEVFLNSAQMIPNVFLKLVNRHTNLKAIQEVLYLFSVKSVVTQGLMRGSLTVQDESLLRLYELFNNDRMISPLNKTKTNTLLNRQRKPLTLAVASVTMENETAPMYEIINSDSFKVMANGIVAYSRRSN